METTASRVTKSGLQSGDDSVGALEPNEETREIRELDACLERLDTNAEMPSFVMNEAERVQKSFQERITDVDSAIEWIKKEIKNLKDQDQSLMKQFVRLRNSLNSLKSRPGLGRKVSLPEGFMSPDEESPSWVEHPTVHDYHSEGHRRRTQSAFAGRLQEYIGLI